MQHIPGLYISQTQDRGRGVFTAHEVNEGDMIEICPVILIPPTQLALLNQTALYHYYFLWPTEQNMSCIALGYGSLYNHSSGVPNAEVTFDLDEETILITATRTIDAGEEILIDYQGGIKNAPDLWFEEK